MTMMTRKCVCSCRPHPGTGCPSCSCSLYEPDDGTDGPAIDPHETFDDNLRRRLEPHIRY